MSQTFAQVIREHAANTPHAPALTFEGITWSFAQLHQRSSQSANALLEAGVRPGDRVALLTRNQAECYELLFSTNKVGAIFVGLNWRLAAPEITAIVQDAMPTVLIVGQGEKALLTDEARHCSSVRTIITLGDEYDAWRAAAPATDAGYSGQPDDVAMLLYTSGTTGRPKGVMLTNHGMSFTRRLAAESWGMGNESVNLVAMPMFHIGGSGYGSSTMLVGGHTVLMREVNTALAIEYIEKYRVTHTFLVPTVVQSMLQAPGIAQANLSSLELLMYGAAPIGDVLLRSAIERLGCKFMHAYGMTETSGTVVVLNPQDHEVDGERSGLLRSVGKPMPWVELRIIDPASLNDVAAGAVGEIWVRSGMVMKGYWNNPDSTGDAIMPGGWLRTGDAAYQDVQGYVYLFDRFKDMIISGGENIYPAEVENALNAHPAVLEVAVIGVPHERWGETPKAIVVLRPGHQADEAELMAFVRERLARYKCPSSFEFTTILPRNASGKLLKHELRRVYHKEPGHAAG